MADLEPAQRHSSTARQQGKTNGGLVELTFDDAQRDATLLNPRHQQQRQKQSGQGAEDETAMLAGLQLHGNGEASAAETGKHQRNAPRRRQNRQQGQRRGQRIDTVTGDETGVAEAQNGPSRRSRHRNDPAAEGANGNQEVLPAHNSASAPSWRRRANGHSAQALSARFSQAAPITPQTQAAAESAMQEKRKREDAAARKTTINSIVQCMRTLPALEDAFRQEEENCIQWARGDPGKTGEGPSKAEGLGRQTRELWQSTRLTPSQDRARRSLSSIVEAALARRWPGCNLQVRAFGSSLTGLVEAKSDVDLCLIDPTRPLGVGTPAKGVLPLPEGAQYALLENAAVGGMPDLPDYYNVRSIARVLEKFHEPRAFREVQPILGANVPIVKFKHSASGLSSDLNVNDTFGIRNSELIKAYCDIAPDIVRPMIYTVKKWASRRTLNDPTGQLKEGVSLNSYTICLIVIQYLQVCGIVPNLQSPALIEALHVPQSIVWQKPARSRGRRRKPAAAEAKPTLPAAVSTAQDTEHPSEQPSESAVAAMEGSSDLQLWTDPVTQARAYNTTFADVAALKAEKLARELSSDGLGPMFGGVATALYDGTASVDVRLGATLIGFFDWLSRFDFAQDGISIRHGQPFRRHEDDVDSPYPFLAPENEKWEDQAMICQDPFIIDRNTSGVIIDRVCDRFVRESRRAADILGTDAVPTGPLLSTLFGRTGLEREQRAYDNILLHIKAYEREDIVREAENAFRRRK